MITSHADYDLSGRNTFRMKVRCALFVEISEEADLLSLDFNSLPQPVFVIGGGSNLLFTGNFPGTVLHIANDASAGAEGLEAGGDILVTVPAGVVFDEFCAWAAKEGLWGPENLSLIPGEVGASAVQNIGAYGVEAKDIIARIRAFDMQERRFVDIDPADCAYGYRASKFKTEWKGRFIITSVTFRLSSVPAPKLDYGGVRKALAERGMDTENVTPTQIRDTIIDIRRQKLPDPAEKGSAGSFFCNPVITPEHFARIEAGARQVHGEDYKVPNYEVDGGIKVPAAWMIEQCGFKGAREGGAAVYQKQPLVIVNDSGNATPEEIMDLEQRVIDGVKEKFGVTLYPEVEHL